MNSPSGNARRDADDADLAKMQAEAPLQLGVKFIVRQRDDARGLIVGLGPHQRGAIAGERQDRERTRGQEMLLGAAVVCALMRDRRHDRGLPVIPAVRRDPGLLANPRPRAIGGYEQRAHSHRHRRARP